MGAWNFYNRVLSYAESGGVIFIKISIILGGVSPYLKIRQISQAPNFWWVAVNLMYFIYFESA